MTAKRTKRPLYHPKSTIDGRIRGSRLRNIDHFESIITYKANPKSEVSAMRFGVTRRINSDYSIRTNIYRKIEPRLETDLNFGLNRIFPAMGIGLSMTEQRGQTCDQSDVIFQPSEKPRNRQTYNAA